MIKQVHNALAVHNNSRTLKFDDFSEIQNFISDNPSPPSPLTIITKHSILDVAAALVPPLICVIF